MHTWHIGQLNPLNMTEITCMIICMSLHDVIPLQLYIELHLAIVVQKYLSLQVMEVCTHVQSYLAQKMCWFLRCFTGAINNACCDAAGVVMNSVLSTY